MCPPIQVQDLHRVGPHPSVGDPGGARLVPTLMGEHVRVAGLPIGVPYTRLYRAAIFQSSQVTLNIHTPHKAYL